MAIPKIIHQVWEGRTESCMPTRLQLLAETWKKLNPTWEYRLWNGADMDQLVQTSFPDFWTLYQDLPYNVQRWDVIRYMILYVYGGVYTDLDTECFKPIDTLLENEDFCFGEEPVEHNFYPDLIVFAGNAFMASSLKQAGWLYLLNEIKESVKQKYATQVVLNTTGPLMVSRIFKSLQELFGVTLLPYQLVAPVNKNDVFRYIHRQDCSMMEAKICSAYCAHYYFGSWDDSFSFYK